MLLYNHRNENNTKTKTTKGIDIITHKQIKVNKSIILREVKAMTRSESIAIFLYENDWTLNDIDLIKEQWQEDADNIIYYFRKMFES